MWNYRESGSGPPLILLHGIGMSHTVWEPVRPLLDTSRRVIAFDVAGFGDTPPLPDATPPTVPNLVDALGHALRAIGIDEPVDMAGNSLGGGMALEAARRGLARSVVAISPIGLWTNGPPPHVPYIFGAMRFTAVHWPALLRGVVTPAWLRELAFAVPIAVGSRRMAATDAIRSIEDLRRATAFDTTFHCTHAPFSGRDITVPVTVAFGTRDFILTKRARQRSALPPHVEWLTMPGWGHVPMWTEPTGVARLILQRESGGAP